MPSVLRVHTLTGGVGRVQVAVDFIFLQDRAAKRLYTACVQEERG